MDKQQRSASEEGSPNGPELSGLAAKIVAAAIIEHGGRFLITRRAPGQTLAGKWEFPGGKLDPGESLAQCLERQLLEELGLETVAGDVVAESTFDYPKGRIHLVALKARILAGELALSVHDRAEWLKPDEILSLELAPADIPIVKLLQEGTDGL